MANDYPAKAPAQVEVIFPRSDDGRDYAVTVTLASLGLAEFGPPAPPGFAGTHVVRQVQEVDFTNPVAFPGAGGPANYAALVALATRAATDYYRHLGAR